MEINNSVNKETTNASVMEEKKETTTAIVPTNTEKQETSTTDEKKEDEMKLTHLNKDFVYELMSVPSNSGNEYRMVTFIVLWARRNNIDYEFDDYGNLYLTKGKLADGEYYPCVTAHLDTVQHKQKLYIQAGQELEVKTRISSGKHEIYVDGMGIGGDDKAGILISLTMFSYVDKLKACFFLEEETGCKGSSQLNVDWFKTVGYVIGYDSPDLNRAAYACSGVKLFNAQFFKEHIKEICAEHGLNDFRSEPFTDVKLIREKTDIICMNFGSGYYNAHSSNEYCVIEDMDTACRMGNAIINHLGMNRYELKHVGSSYKYSNGTYSSAYDEDDRYFDSIRPKRVYGSSTYPYYDDDEYYSYNRGYYGGGTSANASDKKSDTKTDKDEKKETNNASNEETLKYISEMCDEYFKNIKSEVEARCKTIGVDFENFKDIFNRQIKF